MPEKVIQKPQTKRLEIYFFVGGILLLSVIFGIYRFQVESRLRDYVQLWEVDIAKALVTSQDRSLLEKILNQLKYVEPAVRQVRSSILDGSATIDKQFFPLEFDIPISLHLLPVGSIQVGLSLRGMIGGAVTSPVAVIGFLVLLISYLFLKRREIYGLHKEAILVERLEMHAEMSLLAKQVAHDIRSPLSALMALTAHHKNIDDSVKPLISQVSERILAIAEDLLMISREKYSHAEIKTKELATQRKGVSERDLGVGLDELLKEFKAKYSEISFETLRRGESLKGAWSEDEFLRVAANIIQNGVDAISQKNSEQKGKIIVSISSKGQRIVVQFQDDGIGMSQQVADRILRDGGSFGKLNGNGLGLSSAKSFAERYGGEVRIHSKEQEGTLVVLSLDSAASGLSSTR